MNNAEVLRLISRYLKGRRPLSADLSLAAELLDGILLSPDAFALDAKDAKDAEDDRNGSVSDVTLLEHLAYCEHAIWSGWMTSLLSRSPVIVGGLLIPQNYVDYLRGQMSLEYSDLSEQEKERYRQEAANIMPFIREYVRRRIDDATHVRTPSLSDGRV